MSIISTRDSTTDKYSMLSTYDISNEQCEVALVNHLVKGEITSNVGSNSEYVSSVGTFNAELIETTFINNSTIYNQPSGTMLQDSAVFFEYVEPSSQDQQFQSQLINFQEDSSNNVFNLEMLNTSAGIYDANITIQQTHLQYFYDNEIKHIDNSIEPTGASYKAEFDQSNVNFAYQYAVNTKWNSITGPYDGLETTGPDTIKISQDVDFNTQNALGQKGTSNEANPELLYEAYWATQAENSQIEFTKINDDYQLCRNNFKVDTRTNYDEFTTENDIGTFRIQVFEPAVTTTVQLDSDEPILANTDNYIELLPLIDENKVNELLPETNKSNLSIPESFTNLDDVLSLFSEGVDGETGIRDTIAVGYTFNIEINETSNSGYNLELNNLFTDIDNSNLLDNPYYAKNYMTNATHTIEVSESGASIQAVGSSNINNIDNMLLNIEDGERLTETRAGTNGQIIINSNTPTTRVTDVINNGITDTNINVWYTNDENIGSNTPISNEMEENPYVKATIQKITQSTITETNDVFIKNNGGILTLFVENIGAVNNAINVNDVSFNMQENYNQKDINLWRIQTTNLLTNETTSFFQNYDDDINSGTDLVNNLSVVSILQNISDTSSLNYIAYRHRLSARSIESLDLYNVIQNSGSGWSISYLNSEDTYLKSSANLGYSDNNNFPKYSDFINNTSSPLYFTITYNTETTSNGNQGALFDYININYSYDSEFLNSTTVTIPQQNINKNFISSQIISNVTIDSNEYNFIGGGFSKDVWELVYITQESVFTANFNLPLFSYSNIKISTPTLVTNSTYYAIKNKSNNKLAPSSSLNYVVGITDVKNITETIQIYETGTLSITGSISSEDHKQLLSVVQGKTTEEWINISETSNFDAFYGISTNSELLLENNVTGDIFTRCEFMPFNDSSIGNVILDLENYYIPLTTSENDDNYVLTSYQANVDEISDTTILGTNNNYFNILEYSTIINENAWDNTLYTLRVEKTDNTKTITVIDPLTPEIPIFSILINDNTTYLGDYIVTKINNDIWRYTVQIGINENDNNLNETFSIVSYDEEYKINIPNLQGVSLEKTTGIDSTTYQNGASIEFRLLSDFINVNMVGNATNPTISDELTDSSKLIYQYQNDEEFSGILTLSKYRGYATYDSSTAVNQIYNIVRDGTSVIFRVAGVNGLSDLTQTLTTNMYYGENLVVDELLNSENVASANLNISFASNYSIPPSNVNLTIPVELIGDEVVVTILNPNYVGEATFPDLSNSTPLINPNSFTLTTTLKDYNVNSVYTFSGNYNETMKQLSIRPSRLKLYNNSLPYTSVNYNILYEGSIINLYKINTHNVNYFGNPELFDTVGGTINVTNEPDSNKWTLVTSLTDYNSQINVGFQIGTKIIKLQENAVQNACISYYTSVPPLYQFDIVSTENNIVVPYDYAMLSSTNKVKRYIIYDEPTGIFNPFTNKNIADINDNAISVITNNDYVNNMTFTQLTETNFDVLDLVMNPDYTEYAIQVPGVLLSIQINIGNKDENINSEYITLLDNIPITQLNTSVDPINNQVLFTSRDEDGSINFSIVQNIQKLGYDETLINYQNIYNTTNQLKYYNLQYKVGNVAGYWDNETELYFNIFGDGVKPTLYTTVPMIESNIYKIRIYKYETNISMPTVDFYNSSTLVNLSILLGPSRTYYDVIVGQTVMGDDGTWPTLNFDTLRSNAPETTEITWVEDNSYNNDVTIGWTFGNQETSHKFTTEIIFTPNGAKKILFIELLPFIEFKNQFNLSSVTINWDGSLQLLP